MKSSPSEIQPCPTATASRKLREILTTSPSAASWLIGFAHDMVIDRTRRKARLSESLAFQEHESNTDVVAADPVSGGIGLIIKPMFWEPLEENQPIGSIEELHETDGSVVLFVAPLERPDVLWRELKRRASVAGVLPDPSEDFFLTIYQMVRLGSSNRIMALTGWHFMLTSMKEDCQEDGDTQAVTLIDELYAFNESVININAFIPIRPNFLDSRVAQQLLQFEPLAGDIAKSAIKSGIAEPASLAPARPGCHPLRIDGVNAYLCFNLRIWSEYRNTPLWLRLCGPDWTPPDQALEQRLLDAGTRMNSPVILVSNADEDNGVWLPIELESMVERSEVVRLALEQLVRWRSVAGQ